MSKLKVYLMGIFAVSLSSTLIGGIHNDSWPCWRGPEATGVAPSANPPLTWSETKNIKWKVELPGKGTSSPVIWGDKIFYLTAIETDKKGTPANAGGSTSARGGRGRSFHGGRKPTNIHKFNLVCLNRATGKLIWQETAREELPHEGHHPDHGFASYSPVTDGKYVWAGFGSRGVHCYDINGNHQWSRDLGKMNTIVMFGEGSSPALAGNALIVVMDHEGESFIYALEKKTGNTLWKKPRDEHTSWATPLAVDVNGKMQVITNATKFVRSYDLETGDVLWQCSGQTKNVIPCPVTGFGKVFCASGFRGNALLAIELGQTGDLSGSKAIQWQVKEATPYVPSPLLYGDKLYVCYGNKAIISCYQASTGKPYFVKQRLTEVKGIYASPVGAADRVYFVGRKGVTQVLKKSEKFELLATNTLDEEFDASPAMVGKEIFLKGKKYLYCIAEK